MTPRILSFLCMASFVAVASAPPVRADILVVQNQGNIVLPLAETGAKAAAKWVAVGEKDISMESETVDIVEGDYGFNATCTFHMKSHASTAMTRNVAFPIVDSRYFDFMSREFVVMVNGKSVRTNTVGNRDAPAETSRSAWWTQNKSFDYAGFVVWPVTWQVGETKTITCTYNMGEPEHLWGLGTGWHLGYVVRTGGLWKGNIGAADIRIHFRNAPSSSEGRYALNSKSKMLFRVSRPEQAQWVSDTELRWQFKDWNPTEDIGVEKLAWVGFDESYYFVLPPRYVGAQQLYSDAWLEALVEREVKPWKAIFPKEASAFPRHRLKSLIADCLYHEIYARHGDPFVLGKASQKPWPQGASESSDGYLYGKWHGYFFPHLLHGGWYKPDVTKKTKVNPKEFNAIEAGNLRFLQKYIEKT